MLRMTLRRSKSERESNCPTRCVVLSEASFMMPAISGSLPIWLCVSSEKPSSKLEGARLMPGASCGNRVGEAEACCAMVRWRMLCGVRTGHKRANVLAVAGIQLVMLVVSVVVVWAGLLHVRDVVSRCHVQMSLSCDLLWRRVSEIQDLSIRYQRPRSASSLASLNV